MVTGASAPWLGFIWSWSHRQPPRRPGARGAAGPWPPTPAESAFPETLVYLPRSGPALGWLSSPGCLFFAGSGSAVIFPGQGFKAALGPGHVAGEGGRAANPIYRVSALQIQQPGPGGRQKEATSGTARCQQVPRVHSPGPSFAPASQFPMLMGCVEGCLLNASSY